MTPMQKISNVEASQMMKLAAENLRGLSEENQELREKVASYQKRERAEKIATAMEEKGLEPTLSLQEKVAGILQRDDLDVLETAVGLTAPQMKLASVHDEQRIEVEGGVGDESSGHAESNFLTGLASI
jgi:hypothetical protein